MGGRRGELQDAQQGRVSLCLRGRAAAFLPVWVWRGLLPHDSPMTCFRGRGCGGHVGSATFLPLLLLELLRLQRRSLPGGRVRECVLHAGHIVSVSLHVGPTAVLTVPTSARTLFPQRVTFRGPGETAQGPRGAEVPGAWGARTARPDGSTDLSADERVSDYVHITEFFLEVREWKASTFLPFLCFFLRSVAPLSPAFSSVSRWVIRIQPRAHRLLALRTLVHPPWGECRKISTRAHARQVPSGSDAVLSATAPGLGAARSRPGLQDAPRPERARQTSNLVRAALSSFKRMESGTTDAERGSPERRLTHTSGPVSCCSEGKPRCSCVGGCRRECSSLSATQEPYTVLGLRRLNPGHRGQDGGAWAC